MENILARSDLPSREDHLEKDQMNGRVDAFRASLAQEAERLFDYTLQLMEQDIADGWRSYYAREIWLQENLPPPLINAAGLQVMVQRLRAAIQCSATASPDGEQEHTDPGYRNYLDIGLLDIEADGAPHIVLYHTANTVATDVMEHQQHLRYQAWANERNRQVETWGRATRTPMPVSVRARAPGWRSTGATGPTSASLTTPLSPMATMPAFSYPRSAWR